MMKKHILFYCLLCFKIAVANAQKNTFELVGGINYSTINNIWVGQQVILAFKENSPGYKIYPQFGVQLRRNLSEKFNLTTGLKVQRKGDKLGTHQLIPIDTIYSTYMDFLSMPLNIEWKLLPQKNIFWIGGITPSMLFHQSKNRGLNSPVVNGFADKGRLELAIQTGIRAKLSQSVDFQVLVSKGITNLKPIEDANAILARRYQTMLVECSLIYILKSKKNDN
jgi:hypothetical protein